MKLYIDSARTGAIEPLMKTGLFYGVTTNPLLLREAGIVPAQLSRFAECVAGLGAGEVFFQSWGENAVALSDQGRRLARIGSGVVVKLPATREGFEAASRLVKEGIRVCITAVYDTFQAVLAAAAGASYVAPYLGRMNDAGRDAHTMIAGMSTALRNVESSCRILAASVRAPEDVSRLAQNGVRCITLSPVVAELLFQEPLTLQAAKAFEAAAEEIAQRSTLEQEQRLSGQSSSP